jgi:hypothetical protein
LPYLISYPHMDFSFPSIHRLRPLICNTKWFSTSICYCLLIRDGIEWSA